MSKNQNQIGSDKRFIQMKKLFELYDYAEISLVTTFVNQSNSLVFSTIRLLPKDSFQPYTFDLVEEKCDKQKLFFRKVVMKAQDAIKWYRTENGTSLYTPSPVSESLFNQAEKEPNLIQQANFTDENIWGEFALPLTEQNILERWGDNPCPFLGYDSARIHRRFSEFLHLQFLLKNEKAIRFIEQSLYIDLTKYPEYLGGMTLILPNPIIKSIEEHLIPANEANTQELCLFKFNTYPSQNLDKLKMTILTENRGFLKNVKQYSIPENGILTIPQTTPFQSQGYFLVHDDFGCLEFRTPTGYLRSMNLSIDVHSKKIQVKSKKNNTRKSSDYEYGNDVFERASQQVIGAVAPDKIDERVINARSRRLRIAQKIASGQVWFKKENRLEALEQIGEIIFKAQRKVSFYDPYWGELQLTQFIKFRYQNISVEILTSKYVFEDSYPTNMKQKISDFNSTLNKLRKLYPNISCKVLDQNKPDLHDRFLAIDNDIWFIGHSFNQIGESDSLMLKVPDPQEVIANLEVIKSNDACLDFEDFMSKYI